MVKRMDNLANNVLLLNNYIKLYNVIIVEVLCVQDVVRKHMDIVYVIN